MKTFTLILLPNFKSSCWDGDCRRFTATAANRTRARRMAEKAAGAGWWVAFCEEAA